MTEGGAIIGFGDWLDTPAGRYLLAWEQQHADRAVADLFGFHALQLGMPALHGLRANRMGNRWLAAAEPLALALAPALGAAGHETALEPLLGVQPIDVRCDFEALPFDSRSLDLVLLPHSLELARDAHRTLAEVERVLRPEGRVVVFGFNPASLWGVRRRFGGLRAPAAAAHHVPAFAAATGDFIGYRRLRDWLRLLGFDIELGRFGCYRPPVDSERWLERFEWTERWGDRWWPVFGAVYSLTAVKRVRGMRLVGLARSTRPAPKAAPAVVAGLQQHHAAAPSPSPPPNPTR